MMLMGMIVVMVMDVVVLVVMMIVVVIVVVEVMSMWSTVVMGYVESDDEKAMSVMTGKSHNCAQGKIGFPDASSVHMSHDIIQ